MGDSAYQWALEVLTGHYGYDAADFYVQECGEDDDHDWFVDRATGERIARLEYRTVDWAPLATSRAASRLMDAADPVFASFNIAAE